MNRSEQEAQRGYSNPQGITPTRQRSQQKASQYYTFFLFRWMILAKARSDSFTDSLSEKLLLHQDKEQ